MRQVGIRRCCTGSRGGTYPRRSTGGGNANRTSPFHRSQVIGTWRLKKTKPVQESPSGSVPLDNEVLQQIDQNTEFGVLPLRGESVPPITSTDNDIDMPTPANVVDCAVDGLSVNTETHIRLDGVDDWDVRTAPRDVRLRPVTVPMEHVVPPASASIRYGVSGCAVCVEWPSTAGPSAAAFEVWAHAGH